MKSDIEIYKNVKNDTKFFVWGNTATLQKILLLIK